jgi:pimeloyl-ACP methyl ester carboxylesterase
MPDYVLVHGGNMTTETWNRLSKGEPVSTADGTMGGRIWDPVLLALKKNHHRAFAPTLMDEHRSTLSGHVDQIGAVILEHDLGPIVLAGHSYGGMVITGVAAKMPDRIGRLVYIDAALPDPGQSLFDLILSSGRDPLSFAGLEPAPPYVEKLHFDPQEIEPLDKTYVLCTQSDFSAVTQVARQKIVARKEQWSYVELPTSHVPMASMPEKIVQLLLDAGKPEDQQCDSIPAGERHGWKPLKTRYRFWMYP